MNLILAIPIEVRIAGLFVLGGLLGGMANWAVYRLAWNRRSISPWSPPGPKAPRRSPFDRVPIFGWLTLQREASLHGRGFWIRPMLVELAAAFGLAWLYHFEVTCAGLIVADIPRPVPADWQGMLHAWFVAHALLIWLMLVASLIDLDEKTIPDAITVWGTLVGLLIAGFFPLAALPDWIRFDVAPNFWRILSDQPELWQRMTFNAPGAAPDWPDGFPALWPLVVAMGCWGLWCFGLLRRDWYTRHGLGRAVQLCLARLRRDPSTARIGLLTVVGAVAIGGFRVAGGPGWISLLSALIGMAVAGGLIWVIRILGSFVLRREAMGFGDVTLMSMIGVYVGWQASILIFFFAPLAAVAVGLVVLVLQRNNVIPYGPFLCLATLAVLLGWADLWNHVSPYFAQRWLVPGALACCLFLLPVLLAIWLAIKRLIFRF
ncbi:MAG: prepilin peptidase [Pirellulaceae bacterium]|nr:prepilin peptidase [Pirellulaceae bacterium]